MNNLPTHHLEFCDSCKECRVFRSVEERDYWKTHHECLPRWESQ